MENQQKMWGVWCSVSGGVTGHREAWLKKFAGIRLEFLTREAAEAEARRLRSRDGVRYGGGASFTYEAREVNPWTNNFFNNLIAQLGQIKTGEGDYQPTDEQLKAAQVLAAVLPALKKEVS